MIIKKTIETAITAILKPQELGDIDGGDWDHPNIAKIGADGPWVLYNRPGHECMEGAVWDMSQGDVMVAIANILEAGQAATPQAIDEELSTW